MAWAPDYVTAAELKSYLRIGDTADDTELGFAISAASRAVDDHCNRQFGQVASAEARKYTAWQDPERGLWVVDVDDLVDVTGMTVTTEDGTVSLYDMEPANAVVKGMAYTRLVVDEDSSVQPEGVTNEVTVTALWGWASVPTAVKMATLIQAARFHARRDSPYGIAGSPDLGSEMRLLARVDPDVGVSLRTYRRMRAVG